LIVAYRAVNLFDFTYGNVTLQAATLQTTAPLAVYLANPVAAGNELIFSFLTQSNRNYAIQYSDSLPATNWITITTVLGTGGSISVTNPGASGPTRYYRVETK
jgi:hypothetical protein